MVAALLLITTSLPTSGELPHRTNLNELRVPVPCTLIRSNSDGKVLADLRPLQRLVQTWKEPLLSHYERHLLVHLLLVEYVVVLCGFFSGSVVELLVVRSDYEQIEVQVCEVSLRQLLAASLLLLGFLYDSPGSGLYGLRLMV
jgi:hypothetical protein